jgi:UDP-N-acetyl-D-glucosamine/UDP-N-acetyl-D-galactosamine dehydrogenase
MAFPPLHTPGLVGGHCIGVDPYYLTHRARKRAITPIILSGRRISDNVGKRIARECLRNLLKSGTSPGRVTILGLTFKENVPDIWNSRVVDIVRELQSFGIEVQIYDPHVALGEARHEYGSDDQRSRLARPSRRGLFGGGARPFVVSLLKGGRGRVMDVKARLARSEKPAEIILWRL